MTDKDEVRLVLESLIQAENEATETARQSARDKAAPHLHAEFTITRAAGVAVHVKQVAARDM